MTSADNSPRISPTRAILTPIPSIICSNASVTGLAVYHGRFSEVFPAQSAETVIEVSHRFRVAPWLYAAPDVQYVINPGGVDIPDALVIGFEVGIAF